MGAISNGLEIFHGVILGLCCISKALVPVIALIVVINERLNKLYEALFESDMPRDRVVFHVEQAI